MWLALGTKLSYIIRIKTTWLGLGLNKYVNAASYVTGRAV